VLSPFPFRICPPLLICLQKSVEDARASIVFLPCARPSPFQCQWPHVKSFHKSSFFALGLAGVSFCLTLCTPFLLTGTLPLLNMLEFAWFFSIVRFSYCRPDVIPPPPRLSLMAGSCLGLFRFLPALYFSPPPPLPLPPPATWPLFHFRWCYSPCRR